MCEILNWCVSLSKKFGFYSVDNWDPLIDRKQIWLDLNLRKVPLIVRWEMGLPGEGLLGWPRLGLEASIVCGGSDGSLDKDSEVGSGREMGKREVGRMCVCVCVSVCVRQDSVLRDGPVGPPMSLTWVTTLHIAMLYNFKKTVKQYIILYLSWSSVVTIILNLLYYHQKMCRGI